MVVSVSRPATEAGVAVLRRGGNAVDAAVAVAFALAVTYPEAGNIGGGGFMLVWPGKGSGVFRGGKDRPVCIEYRETAPAAATRTMFRRGESTDRHRAVGVPGTVRGLALAHQRYGKLPWKELVVPAVRSWPREGFTLDRAVAASLNKVLRDSPDKAELRRVSTSQAAAGRVAGRRHGSSSPNWPTRYRRSPKAAPDAFYTGPIAEQIVAEMQRRRRADHGRRSGEIPAERPRADSHDLSRLRHLRPAAAQLRRHRAWCQMLNMLENVSTLQEARAAGRRETLHLITEAMRRAYRDRARHLGDPDFTKIPDHLTTKDYAAEARRDDRLAPGHAERRTRPATFRSPTKADSTTHFSVIDADGMAVVEHLHARGQLRLAGRRSRRRVPAEQRDGRLQLAAGRHRPHAAASAREPNVIAPGKRMLSSMTPMIVAKDGKPVLITGSPGGRTIINTVLQIVVNVIDFEMPLADAVAAPRLHHGWLPDEIRFEEAGNPKYAAVVQELKRRGHRFSPQSGRQGDAHSIRVHRDRLEGVADPRISGHAAGF